MILDTLEHADRYSAVHPLAREAWRFLRSNELSDLAVGRYELTGGAYASVQEYTSSPIEECSFESHRRYVDIQYLTGGEEWIYVGSPGSLSEIRDYDETSDSTRYQGNAETRALMRPGVFLLLFPHDAHMPTVSVDRPMKIRKVVVKLPV